MEDSLKMAVGLFAILLARCAPVPESSVEPGSGIQKSDTPSLVRHEGYELLYSELHEQPYWVSYTLTKDEVYGTAERKDNFREDDAVPTGSASLEDYRGSGYDRGHLKPAADSKVSESEMSESFFMSNMSPQVRAFNSGIWSDLEDLVRDWAVEHDSVFIVTGPVLTKPLETVGKNGVSVPSHYYKVVLMGDRSEAVGFILPNEKSSRPLNSFAVSADSVEKAVGFDFFKGLPESVESSAHFEAW